MRLFILPYKPASNSAKLLASSLNCKRIRPDGRSRFRHLENRLVINWGSSTTHSRVDVDCMLNEFYCVRNASNKLLTFDVLSTQNVSTIPYTVSKEEAYSWLQTDRTIYERHTLTGNSGLGIKIKRRGDTLEEAPLYTMGISRKGEYRIHVVRSPEGEYKVLHVQQKRLRVPPPEDRIEGIRNTANGWIFACNVVEPLSEEQLKVAVDAVKGLSLDFGAVDLLIGRADNKAYVLEVNTAPGITGTTLDKYVNFFEEYRNARF